MRSAPIVRLDLNTVPRLNTDALGAAWRACSLDALAQYPGPEEWALRRAIARRLGLRADGVGIGHGSDELLDLAVRALVPYGGTAVGIEPCFSMYPRLLAAHGGRFVGIPCRRRLPVDRLARSSADLTLLASPNNPTGAAFARDSLERLLERSDRPMLLDEAYAEFAGYDALPLLAAHPKLLILRTFSKAYGLPGVRVGYALGRPAMLRRLDRLRGPYRVSTFSLRAARAAWNAPEYCRARIREARTERRWLLPRLRAQGWPVAPSSANFHLLGPVASAAALAARLEKAGLRVRRLPPCASLPGEYLRVTLGTREQNRRLLAELGANRR
ncbi:MAG: pyridoxal phosphate-dependent aminotransferase [Thermoplasmata archaeon]